MSHLTAVIPITSTGEYTLQLTDTNQAGRPDLSYPITDPLPLPASGYTDAQIEADRVLADRGYTGLGNWQSDGRHLWLRVELREVQS